MRGLRRGGEIAGAAAQPVIDRSGPRAWLSVYPERMRIPREVRAMRGLAFMVATLAAGAAVIYVGYHI
jgi:hypothetical protein